MKETLQPLSERALERRLKRHFLKEEFSYFAVCAPGFEVYLLQELNQLPNLSNLERKHGGVEFSASLDAMYLTNLHLRTAHRVLLRIDDFLAQSYPMLFNKAKKVPWELYLGFNQEVHIEVSAKTSRLRHKENIANAVFDGMLTALTPLGLKPVRSETAPIQIFVRLFQDRCTVSINTSGEHLHKRGYKLLSSQAPLRETLAASILMACDWQTYDLIVDPMCGSGTFLLEAALMAEKRLAGRERTFVFEYFPSFQKSKWQRINQQTIKDAPLNTVQLVGSDIDAKVVKVAQENADRVKLNTIQFSQADATTFPYSTLKTSFANKALLIANLPYGKRLGSKTEVKRLHQNFLAQLLSECRGWDIALVTPHPEWFINNLGGVRQIKFKNGGLDVSLLMGRLF